jgi:hypothetical protein
MCFRVALDIWLAPVACFLHGHVFVARIVGELVTADGHQAAG